MFYSRDILCWRGGKFAIIWAEATSFKKLSRRDYLTVNVHKTCEDIISYILLRAEPKRPGGQRPRLSLYLSSQLMYGVVKVYNRQIDFLLADTAAFSSRFRIATGGELDIDMKLTGREREAVTLADIMTAIDRDDPFYDANFGRLTFDFESPLFDSGFVPVLDMLKSPASDVTLHSASPHSSSDHVSPGAIPHISEVTSPFTVPNAEITMKEMEQPSLIHAQESDLQDDFGHLDGPQLDELLREMELASTQVHELHSTPEHGPLIKLPMTPTREVLSPIEETSHTEIVPTVPRPHKSQLPTSPGVTPVSKPRSEREPRRSKRKLPVITMDLSPIISQVPLRLPRRRRHLFTDTDMQISRAAMRENMRTTADISHPMKLIKLTPSLMDLLTKPARKGTKQWLFARNTTKACEGLKLYESDEGRPFWYLPGVTSSESVTSEEARLPTAEEPLHYHRDALPVLEATYTPGSEHLGSREVARDETVEIERGSISLDASRQQSLVSLQTSALAADTSAQLSKRARTSVSSSDDEQRPSLLEADDTIGAAREELPVVPEEVEPAELVQPMVDILSPTYMQPSSPPSAISMDLLGKVSALTAENLWTTFTHICPPTSTLRSVAAATFCAVLAMCTRSTNGVATPPFLYHPHRSWPPLALNPSDIRDTSSGEVNGIPADEKCTICMGDPSQDNVSPG